VQNHLRQAKRLCFDASKISGYQMKIKLSKALTLIRSIHHQMGGHKGTIINLIETSCAHCKKKAKNQCSKCREPGCTANIYCSKIA